MSDNGSPEHDKPKHEVPCQPPNVKAQLMVIDEQTELWKPVGVQRSQVSIVQDECKNYFIQVTRVSDTKELIRKALTSSVEYRIASELFHQWSSIEASTEEKFGLTFSQPTNAKKFGSFIQHVLLYIKNPDLYADYPPIICPELAVPPPARPEKPRKLLDSIGSDRPAASRSDDSSPPPIPSRSNTPPNGSDHGSRSNTPPTPGSHTTHSSTNISSKQSNSRTSLLNDDSPDIPPRHTQTLTHRHTVITPVIQHYNNSRMSASTSHHNTIRRIQDAAGYSEVWRPQIQESLTPLMSATNGSHSRTEPSSSTGLIPREYDDYRKDYTGLADTAHSGIDHYERDDNIITANEEEKTADCSTLESSKLGPGAYNIELPRRRRRRLWCCCRSSRSSNTADYSKTSDRLQCKHCEQWYNTHDNLPGSCRGRKSSSRKAVDCLTCRPLLTTCMSCCCKSNTDTYSSDTPTCDCRCPRSKTLCRRRVLFVILAVIFPCIWFYKACDSCQRRAELEGCCGSKHEPTSLQYT